MSRPMKIIMATSGTPPRDDGTQSRYDYSRTASSGTAVPDGGDGMTAGRWRSAP